MSSARCIHRRVDRCVYPKVGGEATEDKCAKCRHYMGPPRGAGDVVAGLIKATGLQFVADQVMPNGCGGCGERRAALNEAFPSVDNGSRSEPT